MLRGSMDGPPNIGFPAETKQTFKVPRTVLAYRLKIFWIVTAKLRKLLILTFGYDPEFRNLDQSPFHGNEAGSAECNTIALNGRADSPPFVEIHAASRVRWSLNSVTDSSTERITMGTARV